MKSLSNLEQLLKNHVSHIATLSDLVAEYGYAVTIHQLRNLYKDEEIVDYIYQYCIREYYQKRILISYKNFAINFYGKPVESNWENSNLFAYEIKVKNEIIEKIVNLQYKDLSNNIVQQVNSVTNLKEVVDVYGFTIVLNQLRSMYKDEDILDYIRQYCLKEFYEKRIIIRINRFNKNFYGKDSSYLKYVDCNNSDIEEKIKAVIEEIYSLEKEKFIKDNRKVMNLANDFWRLCFLKGPALNKRDLDFSQIKSPSLRDEAKMYFKHKLKNEHNFRNDRGFALLYAGLNIITEQYPYIYHFCDMNSIHISYLITVLQTEEVVTQFNEKYSVESLRKMVQIISAVTEYLMKIEKYSNAPKVNYAGEFVFHNTKDMMKNTEIIPESVSEQLDNYYHELGSNYRLIYEILKETGLRLKEVIFLVSDCLSESKVDKRYFVLEYTPYKILNKLKLSGKPCKQIVLINSLLANKLYNKIKTTESLRKRSESNYIFLSQKTKSEDSIDIAMAQESNYVDAVNRIINKHNILGEDGESWHYTARQARKTLAVIMAENGATSQEIASQLGQHDKRTTEKFYAEVRKKRMAQLNSDYYKKKFAIYVGDENLKQYSEEERRQLYVDFAMNVREVEFGQCSKHISEGPCGKRVGRSNCATCPKLCTGKKYLNKWIELRDSQKYIIDALLKAYQRHNITDYEGFVEYRKEMKLLRDYQTVIDKINEKEGK